MGDFVKVATVEGLPTSPKRTQDLQLDQKTAVRRSFLAIGLVPAVWHRFTIGGHSNTLERPL